MRVALIDDHPVLRGGVRWLLEQGSAIVVVAEAGDAHSALRLTAGDIDVFVMDIGLPGSDGFAATRDLVRNKPDARILMLTMHAREDLVVRALRAGATGFALKDQPAPELVDAVLTVGRGERYVAPKLRTARLETLSADERGGDGPLTLLSQREREVFDLLVRGLSNKELAGCLFISVKTAETHRTRIFRKLGIHGIADLIRLAVREGAILEP